MSSITILTQALSAFGYTPPPEGSIAWFYLFQWSNTNHMSVWWSQYAVWVNVPTAVAIVVMYVLFAIVFPLRFRSGSERDFGLRTICFVVVIILAVTTTFMSLHAPHLSVAVLTCGIGIAAMIVSLVMMLWPWAKPRSSDILR